MKPSLHLGLVEDAHGSLLQCTKLRDILQWNIVKFNTLSLFVACWLLHNCGILLLLYQSTMLRMLHPSDPLLQVLAGIGPALQNDIKLFLFDLQATANQVLGTPNTMTSTVVELQSDQNKVQHQIELKTPKAMECQSFVLLAFQ